LRLSVCLSVYLSICLSSFSRITQNVVDESWTDFFSGGFAVCDKQRLTKF